MVIAVKNGAGPLSASLANGLRGYIANRLQSLRGVWSNNPTELPEWLLTDD